MRHLKEAKNQLTLARARITKLTKELEQKVTEMSKVKKAEYDLGKNKIEAHLKSQILAVCRGFCLRTWTEALDVAGVYPFSELRNLEKVFYPTAIRMQASAPSSSAITAPAQPTQVEDQPSKLSEGATTTLGIAKKTPAPNNVPSSSEVATSGSQPFAVRQSIEAAEKEKGTEDQRAK